jgi:ribonuclease HI
MKKNNLVVFTDGGARGNPGPAASGFIIKDNHGQILIEQGKYLGQATNNVAEYQAVIEALTWLKNNFKMKETLNNQIDFFLDSNLVVNQLNGFFKIKDAKLKNLIIKVRSLEKEINEKIFYHFIPRQKNYHADFLVNQTLDKKFS